MMAADDLLEAPARAPDAGVDAQMRLRAFERLPVALVLTDPTRHDNPIIYVNRAFERLTGYAADAALGRNCRFLQGPDTSAAEVARIRRAIAAREAVDMVVLNYRADGTRFRNRLLIEPIYGDDGALLAYLGVQQAVSDADALASRANAQLHELQHRVKNHLQMVVSMIWLQSRRAQGEERDGYSALAHRVEALQLLYQEMGMGEAGFQPDGEISLGAYLSRIASAISHLEGRKNVRMNLHAEELSAPSEVAAQIGLIASEIITNAFQHAFVGRESGLVEVRLRALSGEMARLEVMDDGVGLPDGLDWPKVNSMGGSIVASLLKNVGATLSVVRGATGASFLIDFPIRG